VVEVSLVICTRNRYEQLEHALQRLLALRPSATWELILVDNGSTDETATTLGRFEKQFACPVKVLYEPQPGLGRARNRGWRAAEGEVIAFTDDDCYPADDFLDRVVQCFAASDLGFMGGQILLFDPTDYPITIQLLDERIELTPGGFIPAGLIQGANLALRRTTLEAIGGFDDGLGAGTPFACEDVDVLARASGAGWKGVYDPRPRVFHHHRRKTAQEASRLMRGYDIGRGAYYTKCILDPALRQTYMRAWARCLLKQNLMKTLREIRGGVVYLIGSQARHRQT
jgi:glycosyltransferase involved in cell wall biosynthesis